MARSRRIAALAALTLLALVLRAPQLGQSLFGDELFAYDEVVDRSFGGMLDAVLHGPEVTPPGFFVLSWLSAKLGDPAVWLRLPSLLAGLALVPVTYAVGSRIADARTALLGAAFVALSPHAAFYAVEARPYALLAVLVAATTACLLRAVDTRGRGWWVAYAALSLAAVGTHLTAVFVLGAQALWALWAHRDQARALLLANAAAAVLFAPWLTRLRRDDVGWLLNLYGGFDPSPREFADELAHVLWGYPFVRLHDLPGVAASVLCGAVLAGVALAGVWAARRGARPDRRELLLGLLPLAVVLGLFANAALSDRDLVSARNLISALPYLALLVAALVTRLPRPAAVAAGAAVAGVLALGAVAALGETGQRPRYRDAAAYAERIARPGDVVLERLLFPAFGEFGRPLTRHLQVHLDPRLRLFRESRDEQEAAAIAAAERGGGRILLVQPSPFATVGVPDALGPFRLAGRRQWDGIHPVAVAIYAR